jgi:hypothetical protein
MVPLANPDLKQIPGQFPAIYIMRSAEVTLPDLIDSRRAINQIAAPASF